MRTSLKQETGFTLIETLIAVAISGLIFSLTANALLNAILSRMASTDITNLHKTTFNIINDITYTARWGTATTIDSGPTIIIYDREDNVTTFKLEDNNIIKETPDGGRQKLNPDNIYAHMEVVFNPSADDPYGITIVLTLTSLNDLDKTITTYNPISLRLSSVLIPNANY